MDSARPSGVYEYTCTAEQWLKTWRLKDWNTARIRCTGKYPQITTWINDLKICHWNGESCTLREYKKERVFEILATRRVDWPAGAWGQSDVAHRNPMPLAQSPHREALSCWPVFLNREGVIARLGSLGMAVTTVRGWLKRRRQNECIVSAICSVLAFGSGVIITGIEFCLLYLAVSALGFVALYGNPSGGRFSLALCSLIIALFFIEAARSRRDELAPELGARLWIVRECLCAGPWLVLSAFHNVARAVRLTGIDIASCEKVLSFLAARNTSASREELLRALPALAWSEMVDQLLLLEGVLFFRPDLSRVGLTEPLRLELRKLLPPKAASGAGEQRARAIPLNQPEKLGCYELLGLSQTASIAEIKRAYRKRMKECHPDRFASAGKEYQELAEEWAKAINAAYETLLSATKRKAKG